MHRLDRVFYRPEKHILCLTVFAKVRCVHRRAQCRALRRAEQGIALRIQKQDGHVAVAGDRLFELADFLLVGIGRRLEDAMHCAANLL